MKKVLLVIGDSVLTDKLSKICMSHGFQSDNVTSIAAALDRMEDKVYDIIVCDADLQDGSGLDLVSKAAIVDPATWIIGITSDETMSELMTKKGCNRVVCSRLAPDELRIAILTK